MREIFVGAMIFTQVGLAAIDCSQGRWRTGIAALLLAACNVLLFGAKP